MNKMGNIEQENTTLMPLHRHQVHPGMAEDSAEQKGEREVNYEMRWATGKNKHKLNHS